MANRTLIHAIAALALLAATIAGCATAASPTDTRTAIEADTSTPLQTAAPTPPQPPTADSTVETDSSQIISKDPVSERSAQVDFSWEQYCYSSDYQLQIARDPDFTIIVLDTGAYNPPCADSPAAYYPAGGLARSPSSLTGWAQLEAGKTYYWRVRAVRSATGQCLRSPWSEVKSFTVKP